MADELEHEPLIIDGQRVDRKLLQASEMRRCRIEECQAHCCGGGVYIHLRQKDDILAHQAEIQPHLPEERRDPSRWFDGSLEPDEDYPEAGDTTGTATIPDPSHPMGTCCIFLLPDRRCALQATGIANGQHPWRFKPFYCALHPITLDQGMVTLDDENEIFIEGGSCNRAEPGSSVAWYQLYDVEMKLVLGEERYAQLVRAAAQ